MIAKHAALLVWSIGTNNPDGPTRMVEVITAGTFHGRPTWRVVHHPHDPTAEGEDLDLYDVDQQSYEPIRSVMRRDRRSLDLVFEDGHAVLRRITGSDQVEENIPLSVAVKPEGPGLQVYLADLPLAPDFQHRFHVVDRWDGTGASRVKSMTLAVVGRGRVFLGSRSEEVFEVVVRPDDDTFEIRQQVRIPRPHYALTVDYRRGRRRVVSEVTTLAIGPAA